MQLLHRNTHYELLDTHIAGRIYQKSGPPNNSGAKAEKLSKAEKEKYAKEVAEAIDSAEKELVQGTTKELKDLNEQVMEKAIDKALDDIEKRIGGEEKLHDADRRAIINKGKRIAKQNGRNFQGAENSNASKDAKDDAENKNDEQKKVNQKPSGKTKDAKDTKDDADVTKKGTDETNKDSADDLLYGNTTKKTKKNKKATTKSKVSEKTSENAKEEDTGPDETKESNENMERLDTLRKQMDAFKRVHENIMKKPPTTLAEQEDFFERVFEGDASVEAAEGLMTLSKELEQAKSDSFDLASANIATDVLHNYPLLGRMIELDRIKDKSHMLETAATSTGLLLLDEGLVHRALKDDFDIFNDYNDDLVSKADIFFYEVMFRNVYALPVTTSREGSDDIVVLKENRKAFNDFVKRIVTGQATKEDKAFKPTRPYDGVTKAFFKHTYENAATWSASVKKCQDIRDAMSKEVRESDEWKKLNKSLREAEGKLNVNSDIMRSQNKAFSDPENKKSLQNGIAKDIAAMLKQEAIKHTTSRSKDMEQKYGEYMDDIGKVEEVFAKADEANEGGEDNKDVKDMSVFERSAREKQQYEDLLAQYPMAEMFLQEHKMQVGVLEEADFEKYKTPIDLFGTPIFDPGVIDKLLPMNSDAGEEVQAMITAFTEKVFDKKTGFKAKVRKLMKLEAKGLTGKERQAKKEEIEARVTNEDYSKEMEAFAIAIKMRTGHALRNTVLPSNDTLIRPSYDKRMPDGGIQKRDAVFYVMQTKALDFEYAGLEGGFKALEDRQKAQADIYIEALKDGYIGRDDLARLDSIDTNPESFYENLEHPKGDNNILDDYYTGDTRQKIALNKATYILSDAVAKLKGTLYVENNGVPEYVSYMNTTIDFAKDSGNLVEIDGQKPAGAPGILQVTTADGTPYDFPELSLKNQQMLLSAKFLESKNQLLKLSRAFQAKILNVKEAMNNTENVEALGKAFANNKDLQAIAQEYGGSAFKEGMKEREIAKLFGKHGGIFDQISAAFLNPDISKTQLSDAQQAEASKMAYPMVAAAQMKQKIEQDRIMSQLKTLAGIELSGKEPLMPQGVLNFLNGGGDIKVSMNDLMAQVVTMGDIASEVKDRKTAKEFGMEDLYDLYFNKPGFKSLKLGSEAPAFEPMLAYVKRELVTQANIVSRQAGEIKELAYEKINQMDVELYLKIYKALAKEGYLTQEEQDGLFDSNTIVKIPVLDPKGLPFKGPDGKDIIKTYRVGDIIGDKDLLDIVDEYVRSQKDYHVAANQYAIADNAFRIESGGTPEAIARLKEERDEKYKAFIAAGKRKFDAEAAYTKKINERENLIYTIEGLYDHWDGTAKAEKDLGRGKATEETDIDIDLSQEMPFVPNEGDPFDASHPDPEIIPGEPGNGVEVIKADPEETSETVELTEETGGTVDTTGMSTEEIKELEAFKSVLEDQFENELVAAGYSVFFVDGPDGPMMIVSKDPAYIAKKYPDAIKIGDKETYAAYMINKNIEELVEINAPEGTETTNSSPKKTKKTQTKGSGENDPVAKPAGEDTDFEYTKGNNGPNEIKENMETKAAIDKIIRIIEGIDQKYKHKDNEGYKYGYNIELKDSGIDWSRMGTEVRNILNSNPQVAKALFGPGKLLEGIGNLSGKAFTKALQEKMIGYYRQGNEVVLPATGEYNEDRFSVRQLSDGLFGRRTKTTLIRFLKEQYETGTTLQDKGRYTDVDFGDGSNPYDNVG